MTLVDSDGMGIRASGEHRSPTRRVWADVLKHNLPLVAQYRLRARRARPGHTLFEVLVALSLSLALLAAVYSALDLHWKYSAAGQEETERLQLVRALFMKMAEDVRGVVYRRPPPGERLRSGVTLPRSSEASAARPKPAQTSDPYVGYGIGIVGDAHRLLLQVSEAAQDSPPLVPQPAAEQSRKTGSRAHSVLWFISRSDGAEKPNSSNVSLDQTEQSRSATEQGTALTRLTVDRFAFDPLDGYENLADDITPGNVLAKEVKTIRFRYFDGSQWLDQWDSVAMRRLPRAVEIVIGFDTTSFALRDFDEKQHSGSYRLVVAVPAYET